jgi:Zn-dependent peptidase ImmA (M78 family)
MNVAHEIGHLILHKDAVVTDRQAEIEAFTFASSFLMPAHAISRDLRATEFDLGGLVEAKRKWGVSIQALIRRGRDLSLISERHYRTLNARITVLGWKHEEPDSAERFAEHPLAVRRIAETAFGTPLPFPRMEKALHVPESELRRFFSRYGTTSQESEVHQARSLSRRVH